MYHYNYEGLVREQQKDIEKSSYNAWKFTSFTRDSAFKKMINYFPFIQRSKIKEKQNNRVCITEC